MFYVIKIKTIKKKRTEITLVAYGCYAGSRNKPATYMVAYYGAINEYSGIINSHAYWYLRT